MRKLFSAALLFAVALTGCGGGGTTTSLPQTPSGPVTWHLQAGASSQQEALQALSFYPQAITIDAGDTLTWTYPSGGEPHTVTFLGPRSSPPPPTDPSAPAPAGGSTYDGSTYTSSGFVMGGNSYSLTFTKPGVYTYYCLVHGGMVGTVTVQPAGTPYPQTQTQVTGQISSSTNTDLTQAASTPAQFPFTAGGTQLAAGISYGLTGGKSATTVLRFLDGPSLGSSVTIAAGTKLTWTNLSSNEIHTVTFGIAGQPFPAMNPFGPPSGGSTYDGSAVANSGILLPGQTYSLTFTKPGTYTYHCLLHDDTANMIGTVIVQ